MDINSPNLGICCKTFFSGSVLPYFIWRWMQKKSWSQYKKLCWSYLQLGAIASAFNYGKKKNDEANGANQTEDTNSMEHVSSVTWCNKWNETFFVTFKVEEDDTVHVHNYFENPNPEKHLREIAIAVPCFGRKGKEVFNSQFHLCYWKSTLPWTFVSLIYKCYLLILLGSWISSFNDLISITQCWLGSLQSCKWVSLLRTSMQRRL